MDSIPYFVTIKAKDINFKVDKKEKMDLYIGVRPEGFKVVEQQSDKSLDAKIEHIENLGSHYLIYSKMENEKEQILIKINDINSYKIGDTIHFEIKPKKVLAFDMYSGERIYGHK